MSNSPALSIWIGFDSRTALAFAVAKHSIRRFSKHIPVHGLVLADLQEKGHYYRRTTRKNGRRQLWDVISEAPMATEFSISRFLVPHLAQRGLALFCDSDVIFRESPMRLFDLATGGKAVYCVQHDHVPKEHVKMDNQVQTKYARKNWSSVMLFDCDHEANKRLTLEMVNTRPGRDLHAFCWLSDDEIGALPAEWNYLVGYDNGVKDPFLVHFTNGLPDMEGHRDQEYADEWLNMRAGAVGAL